jgi:hypothetical protein
MPHFKCAPCKTRFYSAGHPADLVGDLCPGCGALLEPANELSELIGFRWMSPLIPTPGSKGPKEGDDSIAVSVALPRSRRP